MILLTRLAELFGRCRGPHSECVTCAKTQTAWSFREASYHIHVFEQQCSRCLDVRSRSDCTALVSCNPKMPNRTLVPMVEGQPVM